jgi:NAD(P)-dependent dehydrogenase (short-subunit alcohol dehydrogenase family)
MMPVIVITGASSGIGRACAIEFAARGWQVLGTMRRPEDAASLMSELEGRGHQMFLADFRRGDEVERLGAELAAALPPEGLNVLLNNAGFVVAGPWEMVPTARVREQMEVNLLAPAALTRALLPELRRARGRVVMMGSVSGLVSFPFLGPYSVSKFGLEAMAQGLAMEVAPQGIGVSIIAAGPVKTPLWERTRRAAGEPGAHAPELHEIYGPGLEFLRVSSEASEAAGVPVQRVVDRVWHAATARRPAFRYVVGAGWRFHVLRWLPARMRQAIVVRKLTSRSR